MDTRTILAELHTTLHNSRWSRSIAKEPPLTIPAGLQHNVTAYMQGQSSSAFIRQLHCVVEFVKARLDQENYHMDHRFFDPSDVGRLEEGHHVYCMDRTEKLAIYSGT